MFIHNNYNNNNNNILVVVLALLLCLFGWIVFNVQFLTLVLLIVRIVHHLNILIVIIVKMSLWNVVSKLKNDCYLLPAEFTLSPSSGPHVTLTTCNNTNSGDCTCFYNNWNITLHAIFRYKERLNSWRCGHCLWYHFWPFWPSRSVYLLCLLLCKT